MLLAAIEIDAETDTTTPVEGYGTPRAEPPLVVVGQDRRSRGGSDLPDTTREPLPTEVHRLPARVEAQHAPSLFSYHPAWLHLRPSTHQSP